MRAKGQNDAQFGEIFERYIVAPAAPQTGVKKMGACMREKATKRQLQ